MKARMLVDAKGPNPDFNPRKSEGEDNRFERDVPAGTVIDHPDAWVLCCTPGEKRAEPADDEAAERVAKYEKLLAGRKPKSIDELIAEQKPQETL